MKKILTLGLSLALCVLMGSSAYAANGASLSSAEAASQQARTKITGKVLDDKGAPFVGASVIVKGTTIGTSTGVDGTYTLDVPANATLVVASMGYTSIEAAVAGRTAINFTLKENAQDLADVVVVGYGTQKKETLTGSVASISSSDITTTKSENLVNSIQGKVPGLMVRTLTSEPGSFNNYVDIRGYAGGPLIVIDGVARDGVSDFAQLNPDDIESMSILKDASAAIYGMGASNGVILVTTKKGSSGNAKVSYTNMFGFKGATGLSYQTDAYTYRMMQNEMDRNTGVANTYSDDILEKYRTGAVGYGTTDWMDLTMHKQVFQQSHNISIRGGSDKVKYFTSFGYTEDNGLLKSNIQYYNRYNLRTTTTAELSRDLKLNVSVSGRLDNQQGPRENFIWLYKTIIVNDRGVNYHTIDNPDHLSAIAPENKNAYAGMDPDIEGYNRNRNIQFQSTVDLTYTPIWAKGLTLTATAAYDGNINNRSYLEKQYDIYDYYTDDYSTTKGTNQYSNTISLFQRTYARGQVNYTRTWKDHTLTATGVVEVRGTRNDNLSGNRQFSDLYTNDILNQGTSTTATNSGYRNFGKFAAYVGRVNYDYKGKYLFEALVRYDGSYRYAPAKRWATFPSVSAGWRISEEAFIKNSLPAITNLKLRASYGLTGKDAGDAFQYIPAYSMSTNRGYVFNDGSLTVGMVPPGVTSDRLSWIKSKMSNVALDVDIKNGLISGTFEIFQRRNEGLLASRIQSVPGTFGAGFPQENLNSEYNKGFEFSLSHRGKIGNDFNYNVTANFTYSRLYRGNIEQAGRSSSWDNWRNNQVDRLQGGQLWMYDWDGRYTSLEEYETAPLQNGGALGNSKMLPGMYKIIDRNGDGTINGSDQYNTWQFGGVMPPKQFGLNIAASYKSFDINLLLQGAAGYRVNFRNNDIWGYGRYPTLHEKFLDRWHTTNITDDPANPATQWIPGKYPALRNYNYNNTTDANVIDVWAPNATYLRLKSIELGYSLPKNVIKFVGLSQARIYVNGFNLLTFCKKELKDADPERQEGEWDAGLNYPLMKSYNFGISINF